MSSRQTAMTYGVIVACAVAIVLLIADYPSERNLIISIVAGIGFGLVSWFRLERN